ncbi:hypothetical protein [Pseudomonas fluorescens]|uniref:Uncharacterized protein n=1 Tax=Pseudomonas fluorescens TaxID=294 RepID=A0A5E7FZF4_PSEFL|nr:hypothetical protein [Pseudomonas fluorescens]VVO42333.1 hypothetical protein PS833_05989 [Pseudomonas fluorescens]
MNPALKIPDQQARIAVDMAQMANRIAVQPPYFAFRSLYTLPDEWDIYGEFTPEQPQGNELGPLATAEAGRHLAILGSCAAARTQFAAARVYYLASHAQWNLHYRPVRLGQTPWMTARAKIVEQSRKIICAETQLLVDGQPFADLFVSYHVLAEKTFDKLYARHRSPAPLPSGHSPYAEAFPLSVLELSDREITACSVDFSAARCEGHFPQYAMWPVAVVMYGMSQAMSRLLDHKMGRAVSYRLLHVTLDAAELVPADKQLQFNARLASMDDNGKYCDLVLSAAYAGRVIATACVEVAIE